MTITTEKAEQLALSLEIADQPATAEVIRSLAAERDTLRAENARLLEAIEMARDCLEDKDVIGARQTLTIALGETQ